MINALPVLRFYRFLDYHCVWRLKQTPKKHKKTPQRHQNRYQDRPSDICSFFCSFSVLFVLFSCSVSVLFLLSFCSFPALFLLCFCFSAALLLLSFGLSPSLSGPKSGCISRAKRAPTRPDPTAELFNSSSTALKSAFQEQF